MIKNTVEIIAEAGVNHNGCVDRALQLVDAAVKSGADLVKFQTFSADSLVTANAPLAAYQKKVSPADNQYSLLKSLELTTRDFQQIAEYCDRQGIEFLSTPFDLDSLGFLVDKLGLQRIKVASGEITNGPLLLAAAQRQRELIISTGMATEEEIEQALAVVAFGYHQNTTPSSLAECMEAFQDPSLQQALRQKVTLLHCTSQYPAPYAQLNLAAMQSMGQRWHVPIGYSDHSRGIAIPIAATALGASIVEKHLTLDKSLPGPDHKASLNPREFTDMVDGVRAACLSIGTPEKKPQRCEFDTAKVARKSLIAATGIQAGETFSAANVTCQRPGTGMSPMQFWSLLSQSSRGHYQPGDLLHE